MNTTLLNTWTRLAFAFVPLALVGCAAPSSDDSDGDLDSTVEAWTAALPVGTSGATAVSSVTILGCKFTVGTAIQAPPYPPKYVAYVQKTSTGTCTGALGYQVLGYSYSTPAVSIAKHPFLSYLSASYTMKQTPSGSAHYSLGIARVAFSDGRINRTTSLAAMADPGNPSTGNVTSGALSINLWGDLTVTGNKNGTIPGETGTGSHFIARYVGWCAGTTSSVAPTSLTAY